MITIVMSTKQRDDDYIKKVINASGIKNAQFLCYENKNEFSLTEIYNKGLAESENDIVVFMHDDLVFESNAKWGIKLIEHFKKTEYGILGKAGTTKVAGNAIWWQDFGYVVGRVYHEATDPNTQTKKKWLSAYSGHFEKLVVPVVLVDGLFFAVHKQRIKTQFDENVKGFHFYDVDFCLSNYKEGVKIGVVYDFNVTHKSIGQTNDEWEANRKQIAEKHASMLPVSAQVEIVYTAKQVKIKKEPKVSIVVPTKGKTDLVQNLVESILEKSNYQNYEFILADTGSTPEDKATLRSILEKGNDVLPDHFKMVEYDYYNYAKINNDVVRNHTSPDSELILLCNNDIKFINDCLTRMVETYLQNKRTCGTVGARLHYEDNTVQHAGIFLLKQQNQKYVQFGHYGHKTAYRYENKISQVPGNTAALLLVDKKLFESVGMLNEAYQVCFEDVELNFSMLLKGLKNYQCGEAVAYHYESQTRGQTFTNDDRNRIYTYIYDNYEKLAPHVTFQ